MQLQLEQGVTLETLEVFVFHFDVVGFVDQFLRSGEEALIRLRKFQREARQSFCFGRKNSFVVTLYDNVWSRVNAIEPGLPSLLLNYAGDVMHVAHRAGFPQFFGCITRGTHDFDPNDRMLVGRESFEDLSEQHIDVTSEPHLRAALAEKWGSSSALPQDCVWVSAEAVAPDSLEVEASFPDSTFSPFASEFDLARVSLANGRRWPFAASKFRAIRAKAGAHEA